MALRHRIAAFSLLSALMLAPAVFGFAVPAMAEDAPAEQQTAVVGQSENLTATVPVDDKGQAVITQHDDGTWWTSITITYSGPTTLDPMVVERNGVTISREPSLFLVASAQPAVGTANSQDGFVSAMEAWDLCRLEVNTRYLTGAVSLNEYSESQGDIQGEMVTCAENEGLGQVLTTDDETGGNSFAFEFIKEDARTFTYEVPVGNLGQHPWVGVSAYTCLWPDSYVRGELTAEQVATINQIGGAAREFNEGGTISRTAWVPCVYEAREFTEIEVSVPQVMAPLPGPKAEPGTSMHPSGFSWLAPLQQSSTGNTLTVDLSLSHVLVTAVAGMVLVILVALPTQLLDSTLSRNETKIAKAIRRFLPSGSAARIETLSEQRVAAEQAAAAATVALANGANLPTPDSLPETTVDASQAQEPSSQKPATDGEEGAKS